jgi:hypothetical protein
MKPNFFWMTDDAEPFEPYWTEEAARNKDIPVTAMYMWLSETYILLSQD